MKEVMFEMYVSESQVVNVLDLPNGDFERESILEVIEMRVLQEFPKAIDFEIDFPLGQEWVNGFCQVWDEPYEDCVIIKVWVNVSE